MKRPTKPVKTTIRMSEIMGLLGRLSNNETVDTQAREAMHDALILISAMYDLADAKGVVIPNTLQVPKEFK